MPTCRENRETNKDGGKSFQPEWRRTLCSNPLRRWWACVGLCPLIWGCFSGFWEPRPFARVNKKVVASAVVSVLRFWQCVCVCVCTDLEEKHNCPAMFLLSVSYKGKYLIPYELTQMGQIIKLQILVFFCFSHCCQCIKMPKTAIYKSNSGATQIILFGFILFIKTWDLTGIIGKNTQVPEKCVRMTTTKHSTDSPNWQEEQTSGAFVMVHLICPQPTGFEDRLRRLPEWGAKRARWAPSRCSGVGVGLGTPGRAGGRGRSAMI